MAPLGVPALEERLYRALLADGPASPTHLAKVCAAPGGEVRRALGSLQAKGMVTRSAHRRPLYGAVAPEVALNGLLAFRREELEASQVIVADLMTGFRRLEPSGGSHEAVDIVSGPEAVVRRVTQLERSAKTEILMFDTPPCLTGSELNSIEVEKLRRGVRYRTVYDRRSLEWPGQLDQIRELVRVGEEARTCERLPMKLVIFDREVAVVPLTPPDSGRETQRIVIHPSPLLDGLISSFEHVWERAAPIRSSAPTSIPGTEGDHELSDEDGKLLMLLAADLTDDAIGRQLGITGRSVQRRLRKLMDRYGAPSRLQLLLGLARDGMI